MGGRQAGRMAWGPGWAAVSLLPPLPARGQCGRVAGAGPREAAFWPPLSLGLSFQPAQPTPSGGREGQRRATALARLVVCTGKQHAPKGCLRLEPAATPRDGGGRAGAKKQTNSCPRARGHLQKGAFLPAQPPPPPTVAFVLSSPSRTVAKAAWQWRPEPRWPFAPLPSSLASPDKTGRLEGEEGMAGGGRECNPPRNSQGWKSPWQRAVISSHAWGAWGICLQGSRGKRRGCWGTWHRAPSLQGRLKRQGGGGSPEPWKTMPGVSVGGRKVGGRVAHTRRRMRPFLSWNKAPPTWQAGAVGGAGLPSGKQSRARPPTHSDKHWTWWGPGTFHWLLAGLPPSRKDPPPPPPGAQPLGTPVPRLLPTSPVRLV